MTENDSKINGLQENGELREPGNTEGAGEPGISAAAGTEGSREAGSKKEGADREENRDAAEKKENPDADSAAAEAEDEAKAGEGGESREPGADEETRMKPDKKDRQIEELNDKYKRLFAEFDNYRKRTEAEKGLMFAEGQKAVLMRILPLIDNFERAIDAVPEDQKDSAMAQGIEKVYRSFMDQLAELGVTAIEAVGKQFDAGLHNAVMHTEDEEFEENTVIEEFQKGYMFRDKVLRYSMVKVAN